LLENKCVKDGTVIPSLVLVVPGIIDSDGVEEPTRVADSQETTIQAKQSILFIGKNA